MRSLAAVPASFLPSSCCCLYNIVAFSAVLGGYMVPVLTVSNVDKYQFHFTEDNLPGYLKLKCFVFIKLLKDVI
jgi:hypothetical protein